MGLCFVGLGFVFCIHKACVQAGVDALKLKLKGWNDEASDYTDAAKHLRTKVKSFLDSL